MKIGRIPGRPAGVLSAAFLLGAATVLAACGSSGGGSTSSAGTSTSGASSGAPAAQLAKYSGDVILTQPGPAFDASKAKGKTVMIAAYTAENPALSEADNAFTRAMQKVGVKVILCDGKASPTGYNACFAQGISQKVSAILAQGSSPKTYTVSLAAAKKAGIPVIEGANTDPRVGSLASGLQANAGPPWQLVGSLMADWVLGDNKARDAHILYLSIPDVDGALQEASAFASTIKADCPNCTIVDKGISLADWARNITPATSSALLADPKITYVVPGFDPMVNFAGPAITQTQRQDDVKIVTSGGSFQQMSQLKSGQVVNADVGIDYPGLGFLEADQILRAVTGAPQVEKASAPVKVFTRDNVGSVDVTQDGAQAGTYYAPAGTYDAVFYKAWQLAE